MYIKKKDYPFLMHTLLRTIIRNNFVYPKKFEVVNMPQSCSAHQDIIKILIDLKMAK